MTHLHHKQRGVTMIELLISIVIVSMASAAVLGVLAMTTGGSADPMIRHQAAAIADAYLEEIMLKPIDDPDGVDGEGARADFDDLDDYDGLADAGARDQFGNLIAGLGDYDIAVSVAVSTGLPSVAAGDQFRVDVVVTQGVDINYILSSYRTRF